MTATSPTAAAPERFERPRASVDPDRSLGWLRRLRPVVLVQKWHFIGSIVAGLVSMAATVSVPIMLGGGIGAVADGDTPRRSSPACSGSPSSGSSSASPTGLGSSARRCASRRISAT